MVRPVARDQAEPADLVERDFNQDSLESVVMGNATNTSGPHFSGCSCTESCRDKKIIVMVTVKFGPVVSRLTTVVLRAIRIIERLRCLNTSALCP